MTQARPAGIRPGKDSAATEARCAARIFLFTLSEKGGVFFMRIEHHPRFLDQLKRHEGLRLEAYRCPAGALTIGYGHNLDQHPVPNVGEEGDRISRMEALKLLELDVRSCGQELDGAFPWWRRLAEPRQAALLNMCFNLGLTKLAKFRKMWAALESEDYARASEEMLDSKWKSDVKGRALELAAQMRTGAWQEGA